VLFDRQGGATSYTQRKKIKANIYENKFFNKVEGLFSITGAIV